MSTAWPEIQSGQCRRIGEAMLRTVEIVGKWNKEARGDGGFCGIVWDVEPYLLMRWETDPVTVMAQFVQKRCKGIPGCKRAGSAGDFVYSQFLRRSGHGGVAGKADPVRL